MASRAGAEQSGPAGSMAEAWEWLNSRKSLLLVSHERPDGDAFASVCALFVALRQSGKRVSAYFPSDTFPLRYRPIFKDISGWNGIFFGPELVNTFEFDGLVCLDSSNWSRVDLPRNSHDQHWDVSRCNIDHHGDNSLFAEVNWVDADYAATCQMVYDLIKYGRIPISATVANLLLTGLITDSGGFRYQNTKAATLRAAADLLEYGAEHDRIIDALYYSEPYNKLLLNSYLLENACFKYDGRLLYTVLEPAMLEKFGLSPADTEDCIDILRGVAGVEVSCIIQPGDEGVRFSLRSRRLPYNVAEMAHQLGGGGHSLAAGINLPKVSFDEALKLFLAVTKRWFEK